MALPVSTTLTEAAAAAVHCYTCVYVRVTAAHVLVTKLDFSWKQFDVIRCAYLSILAQPLH